MRIGSVWVAVGAVLAARPAVAECLGSCADAMFGALLAFVIYGVLGIAVLVMLIRSKWRRAGVKLLLLTALAAIGLPLLSQGWSAWKLRAMESRELAGPLPDLDGKTVLLLTGPSMACYYDLCSLLLLDRGEPGAYVLPLAGLEGLESGKPLSLADLPLELWQPPAEGSSDPRTRPLTEAEAAVAAQRIDYVIVQPRPWSSDEPETAEAALRRHPVLAGLKPGERVKFAFGPVEGGKLDLASMRFDLLDLWLEDEPLALILAPYNTQDPGNTVAGRDALIKALCTEAAEAEDIDCDYALR